MYEPPAEAPHPAERVAALAFDVIAGLPVPGARWLPAASVEDVRADALAAVWRAAMRAPDGFLDEHGRADPGAVAAYASSCLRKGFDEIRRERRAADAAAVLALEQDRGLDATVDSLLAREDEARLSASIAQLPPAAAAVVARRRLGWSFDRIADELGIRRNTAIQRYSRALRRLAPDVAGLLPPRRHRGR